MATLITSGSVNEKTETNARASSYEEYSNSRKEVPFDEKAQHAFHKGKDVFNKSVIQHLSQTSPQIKIGEYFVFRISELKKLIESSPEADHIRFHNSVDEHNYHKLYAVPVHSKAIPENKEVINKTSVLLDSFPCPPDPRCPT
jgi:hypothetical protein